MTDRGTGLTTNQMRGAPRNAIYIWPATASRRYAVELARHLQRADLRIETPAFFEGDRWRGLRVPIVMDHATSEHMPPAAWEGWRRAMDYQRYVGGTLTTEENAPRTDRATDSPPPSSDNPTR